MTVFRAKSMDIREPLADDKELLQAIIQYSFDAIAIVDSGGFLRLASPSMERLLGYPAETLLGHDIFELVHPEDRSRVRVLFDQMVQSQVKRAGPFEYRCRCADGSHVFLVSVVTNLLSHPSIRSIIIDTRDISERKRTEALLRRSEDNYRALFEESRDAVYITSMDGKILAMNPAGLQLFGCHSLQELMQYHRAQDYYWNPGHRAQFEKAIQKQGFVQDFESEIRTRDGQKRTVLETATVVRNDNGEIVAYRGILRDITDKKMLEDRLRHAQKMESLGTLAGGIAHDFNNILAIILGYASQLEHKCLDTKSFMRSLSAIIASVQRGSALVRQLLTFARRTESQLQSIDVNKTIRDLQEMLRATFPKTIYMDLHLDRSISSITADASQVHQTLLNLCVNARDAMPEGGRIDISTEKVSGSKLRLRFPDADEDEYVQIVVKDTGDGMNEETRLHVFEPFFTTKGLGKGTGLGLALVYGIVRGHQGFIEVESEKGKGATFLMYFPVTRRPPENFPLLPKEQRDVAGGKETIFVIEDEELLLELVDRILTEKGYAVLKAADGLEAVEIYKSHKDEIALVLSDLGLPKLDGLEAVQQMLSINPGLKVIVASGYMDPNTRSRMIEMGAKEFIQKPYVPTELLTRIREVLDERECN